MGAIIAEGYLRADGRYADLVDENLVASRAIWDRPVNARQYRKHPDLGYDIEIVFNDFGIRNHRGVSKQSVTEFDGQLIGVFGDSMTENRRIDDRFTFTSILDDYLPSGYQVLNFGVDGYGADQSYLKYLDFEANTDLDYVLYLFVQNDLRNLYENQLFEFSNNEVGEPVAPRIDPLLEFARHFHVVYMVFDAYARLKARVDNKSYELQHLNHKIEHSAGRRHLAADRPDRVHDEYADSMVIDFLSDNPAPETLLWGDRFRQLVRQWKTDVEETGNRFFILVMPSPTTTRLAKRLFESDLAGHTFYLVDDFPEGYKEFVFENDNHWNESGNLRAARAIVNWGSQKGFWPMDEQRWATLAEETIKAIEAKYEQLK